MTTVRDGFFEVLRSTGMTTVFSNPGSTEIPLVARWPPDIDFVLCLHEGSAVGAAAGWAVGSDGVGLALVHTTAGYANAIGAVATARANRIPLVLVVGQQDRRHLANQPFLTGELDGLAGTYPVFVATPTLASDVPGLVARARHEALLARGPAVVIVPMDDWLQPYDATARPAAPRELRSSSGVDEELCSMVADRLRAATSPVLVAGAGADDSSTWCALESLARSLGSRVWQEPFGSRAGFRQDSPIFAGHLPSGRSGVRSALSGHDLVLVVGTAALRQYSFEEGELFAAGVDVIVLTDDRSEATRSVADLVVFTSLPGFCQRLAESVIDPARSAGQGQSLDAESPHPAPRDRSDRGDPLVASDVFEALRARLAPDTIILEESPSSRRDLQDTLPARQPLTFLSAAMGGLGFALPAAIGLRMAKPTTPVVAVIGDGSSLYSFQGLWTAHKYGVGALFVILSNGGYAIMDRLTDGAGGVSPWPDFDEVNIAKLAESLGCPAQRVDSRDSLDELLDTVVPTLSSRTSPLVLDVALTSSRPKNRPLPLRHTRVKESNMALIGTDWNDNIFVDGWVAGAGGRITVTSPGTGATLGVVGAAAPSDVAQAAAAASRAQREWAARSPIERAAVLRRAGALWEEHSEELADWIVRESGSIPPKAALEVATAAQECYEAAGLPSHPLGEVLPSNEDRWSFARRRPAGVVTVIAPFNFPLILSIRSVAPALALGNAVLLKPDPRTTVCGGVALVEVFRAAGLPDGLLQLLPGGREVGEAMISAPEVRVVSFTGSTTAGRAVGALGAQHLKRTHLELGGNSALIVLPGADMKKAVSAGAFGSFMHQGQICMTTGRHLVHESIHEEYVDALAATADHLPVGDPASGHVALGPIIDQGQLDKIDQLVQHSVSAGARLAAGGKHEGLFYRPTVLADVTGDMPAWQEEIFGPVAPVRSFSSSEEAAALAQESDYGLSLGILGDVGEAMKLADAIPSGIIHINEQTVADEANAPFGGVAGSGTGSRFGGAAANIEAFTETQWLTVRPDIAPYPF